MKRPLPLAAQTAWNATLHAGAERRDVTATIPRLLDCQRRLVIDPATALSAVFGIRPGGAREWDYLRIDNRRRDWRPLCIGDSVPCTLYLGPDMPEWARTPIRIVYFINARISPKYRYLLRSQLRHLMHSGLLADPQVTLHVVSVGDASAETGIRQTLAQLLRGRCAYTLENHREESYEYRGILKTWELARDASGLILYFHGKGISHMRLGALWPNRQQLERRVFRRVIGEWRANLQWLERVESAQKLGMCCGGSGWVWYNFWWARADYVHELPEPAMSSDRYYYEKWLGQEADTRSRARLEAARPTPFERCARSCLNIAFSAELAKYNLGSSFSPEDEETDIGLRPLHKRLYRRIVLRRP